MNTHPSQLQQLWDLLGTISLLQGIVLGLLWVGGQAAIVYGFTRWVLRRSWHLHQHLGRPVILLQPIDEKGALVPGGDLSPILHLLKKNGFLNVRNGATDYRSFDPGTEHCLVVLGYLPGMAGLDDLLARIKTRHVPLIVYTFGNNMIPPEDKKKLDNYPYMLPANFPLTLLNAIFATVASFPYSPEKK